MMDLSARHSNRAVAIWIYAGVIMLLVQVILGGVTRLTGSGLSITEWNIVTHALPPLNQRQWLAEFDKYRQTPQYQLLNFDFTLKDFKSIFFWEWLHRTWAKLIGVVFLAGFAYLVFRNYLRHDMRKPLLILFLLGAMQGIIGWIMVLSGLTGEAVFVKPTKLALHFVFALGLICYAFWFALQLSVPAQERVPDKGIRQWTRGLIVLLVVQLMFGALMAGHKAAPAAPTWPEINDSWLPAGMFSEQPLLRNLVENKITIHFIHRSLAYIILALIIVYTIKLRRLHAGVVLSVSRLLPLVLVILQVVWGIVAVLISPHIRPNHWGGFEWVAQLHQLTGMLLLLSLVNMLYLTGRKSFALQR